MPAKAVTINLLPKDDLTRMPGGKVVTWAMTYGRYIMIGTEIIVLLAFISRFSLDRKLTDLKEQISQKQAILEANRGLEEEIRSVQSRVEQVTKLVAAQQQPVTILDKIQATIPTDVRLLTYRSVQDTVTADVVAGSTTGFSQFLSGLSSIDEFTSVEIGNVKKQSLLGIEFQFTGLMRKTTEKEE